MSIEPYRDMVKPNVNGFEASGAGYHASQFMTLNEPGKDAALHREIAVARRVTLTFVVMRLEPGGQFSRNRKTSPEVQPSIEAAFHLDEPFGQQFGRFVWGVVRLDLGPSTRHRDYSRTTSSRRACPFR